jgi:hypothetical protein
MEENKTAKVTTGTDTPASKVEKYLREREEYLKKHVPEGDPEKREAASMPLSQQYRRTSHLRNLRHGGR